MKSGNHMKMQLPAYGKNESFARNAVAGFAVECSPTVSEIGDIKTAVSEAVTNAVVHAYDEEREENLIEICADIDCDNVLTVSVRDFGKGIADVEEAKEPFFTTKESGKGTGLGLAIVQQVVEAHGGEIAVESAPGKGAAFIVHLPAAEGEMEEPPEE